VYDYVEHVEMMQAADFIVCKAGGLIVSKRWQDCLCY
jgi:UDP-N-acetylglucosamine:LPS N-acetylglucosamine transferase